MQPMVATTKEQARANFGRRLNELLDSRKIPQRGRPAYLYRLLKQHNGGEQVVSGTQCQKYLNGLDLPDEGNKAILADALGVLHSELYDEAANEMDASLRELSRLWTSMDEDARQHVLQAARFAAGKK
jgi:hypothetical protein